MDSSIKGLTKYYQSLRHSKVNNQAIFMQRCARCLKQDALTIERIKLNATLEVEEYKEQYLGRRSIRYINGESIDVKNEFNRIESPVTSFAAFRNRLTTFANKQSDMALEKHTDLFSKAGLLSQEHWKYFIEGGRAKPFVYSGSNCPKVKGR